MSAWGRTREAQEEDDEEAVSVSVVGVWEVEEP